MAIKNTLDGVVTTVNANNGSSSTWKTPYYGDATNHATVQYY